MFLPSPVESSYMETTYDTWLTVVGPVIACSVSILNVIVFMYITIIIHGYGDVLLKTKSPNGKVKKCRLQNVLTTTN